MDKNVSALVSALDAIAFTRNQNPSELKLIARNALKGWASAQQSVQADGDYWKCVCGELHMEGGTYCDVCGTDRPRR